MATVNPATFQSAGVLCGGQPFPPDAAPGRCICIVQDEQVLDAFAEQCRDLGPDIHAAPHLQISYQRDRGDFLRIAVILSHLAQLQSLTVMGLQRPEGPYPEAAPSTRVIIPVETLLYPASSTRYGTSRKTNLWKSI